MSNFINELQAIERYAKAGLENNGNQNSQFSAILIVVKRVINLVPISFKCSTCHFMCVIEKHDQILFWFCENCNKKFREITNDELNNLFISEG